MSTLIVLLAHTPVASALKALVSHVYPLENHLVAYDVLPDDDPEEVYQRLWEQLSQQANNVDTVLLLSDLIGATPSNIAQRLLAALKAQQKPAVLLSGMNAGMVLNAVRYQAFPLPALAEKILEGAQKCIQVIE